MSVIISSDERELQVFVLRRWDIVKRESQSRPGVHDREQEAGLAVSEDHLSPCRTWIMASRPKTLPAAIAPVLVGSAYAYSMGGFQWATALAAFLVAVWIQIGTNLHNDVVDFERGTDTDDRLGPTRVTQAGLLSPGQVHRGAWLSFGLAGLAGLYLAWVAGWVALILGTASILAGMAYTAGPYPLSRIGLGDLFVMLFFGYVALCGTVFVHLGVVPLPAWWWALSVGATITALLDVNNIRDMETDRRAGRRTLPVAFGHTAAIVELVILEAAAYLAPVGLVVAGNASPWVLIVGLSAPLPMRLLRMVMHERGRALNKALALAGQWILAYASLLSLGLVMAGIGG